MQLTHRLQALEADISNKALASVLFSDYLEKSSLNSGLLDVKFDLLEIWCFPCFCM